MALELTQPVTEMITRNISLGKGGRCVGLTTLPPPCADCLEIWESQPPGTLRTCPGLSWDCFPFFNRRNCDGSIDGWKDGRLVRLEHKCSVKGDTGGQKNGGYFVGDTGARYENRKQYWAISQSI